MGLLDGNLYAGHDGPGSVRDPAGELTGNDLGVQHRNENQCNKGATGTAGRMQEHGSPSLRRL